MKVGKALIILCVSLILTQQCIGQRHGQGKGGRPVAKGQGQGNHHSAGGNDNQNNGNNGQGNGANNPYGAESSGINQGNGQGQPHAGSEDDLPPQFVNVNETRGPPLHSHGRPNMPRSVELRFKMPEHDMMLNLTWNKHVTDAATIVIGNDRNHMKKYKNNNKKEFNVYTDPSTQASMIVRESKKKPNVLDYLGSFFLDADEYVLEPTDWDMPSWDNVQSQHQEADPGNTHMIYKKKRTVPEEDYELDERAKETPGTLQDGGWTVRSEGVPLEATGKASYGVQSLIVIDFALYKSWFDRSTKATNDEKMEEAIDNIQFYFAHVQNGIDMRYRSIDDDDFEMYVSLAGYYIPLTPDAAPFTLEHLTPGFPHGDIAAYDVIDSLIDWLSVNRPNLPPFDQATMFTNDYLISAFSGNRILGLAQIEGVCSHLSVALNRDEGVYSSQQTGAHEMGHNLGALHDGADNACSTGDQYIMASYPITLTDATFSNPFTFSACSVDEFKRFMGILDSQNGNCLRDFANHNPDIDIEVLLSQLPGQEYTPDQQCQQIFGEESYFCGGATEEKQICSKMECFHPEFRYCYSTAETRAAPGTTCGHSKWCEEGECVFNSLAPSGPDYCLYGDYDGPYRNGLTCAIIYNEQPWRCYDDYYKDDCCQSCQLLSNTDDPECEYGDKAALCATLDLSLCSDPNRKDLCCATCSQAEQPGSGECALEPSWCPSFIKLGRDCYGSAEDCCETCKQYETNLPGCEYGDRATWCFDQTPRQCYGVEDICCKRCYDIRVSNDEDCLYGDKIGSCDLNQCTTASGREDCCGTCKNFINSTSTITTTTSTTVATTTPRTTTTGSECVDNAGWCEGLSPHFCYGTERETCCKTCSGHYTGVPNCEYGDQHAWCSTLYCQSPSLKLECCVTCSDNSSTTATTSTTTASTAVITKTTTVPTTHTTTTDPSSECLFEDYKGCVDRALAECYNTPILNECCNFCTSQQTNDPSCRFRDHAPWCENYITAASYCTGDTLTLCCDTCKRWLGESTSTSSSTTTSISTTSTTRSTTTVQPTVIVSTTPSIVPWPGCFTDDQADWCSTITNSNCYVDADYCCPSCRQHWIGWQDCEFGDKARWCGGYVDHGSDCYGSDVASTCCKSCDDYKTYIPGCEFGDRQLECDITYCSDIAYKEQCCLTCSGIGLESGPTNPPIPSTTALQGAPTSATSCYGDKATWCSNMDESNCYNDVIRNTCCETCQNIYTQQSGCEYGDHFTWCKTIDPILQCPYYVDQCCVTCAR